MSEESEYISVICAKLEAVLKACEERAGGQSFDAADGQQMASVALLGSILELSRDCLDLLRHRRAIGPRVVLRSLLEAWAELVNLADDANYLGFMQYAQWAEQLKLLKAASRPDAEENPYFEDLKANEDLDSAREELEEGLEKLRAQGFKKLPIAERFRRADEQKRKDAVYSVLAQHSHHNVGALQVRHVAIVDGEPRIVFFKPEDAGMLRFEADTVVGIAANAVGVVSKLIDGEATDMGGISAAVEAFRSTPHN